MPATSKNFPFRPRYLIINWFMTWMTYSFHFQIQDTPEQQNCCFNCAPCDDDQFLKNETLCETCPNGFWPNEEKTGRLHTHNNLTLIIHSTFCRMPKKSYRLFKMDRHGSYNINGFFCFRNITVDNRACYFYSF